MTDHLMPADASLDERAALASSVEWCAGCDTWTDDDRRRYLARRLVEIRRAQARAIEDAAYAATCRQRDWKWGYRLSLLDPAERAKITLIGGYGPHHCERGLLTVEEIDALGAAYQRECSERARQNGLAYIAWLDATRP